MARKEGKLTGSEVLVPMGDRLVVVSDGVKETTEGGIIVAPQAQDRPTTGTVEAVGGDVEVLAPGDRVCYAAWSGTEYLAGGRTYLILRESEIVGKLVPGVENA